jgi:HSP20 family molecular chaperone IbpA
MSDRDQEARLQEVRRRARELRQQPARGPEPERSRGREAKGPVVTSWRPAGRGEHHHSEARETWSPRARVFDRDGTMIVRIELPGLDGKDVEVCVEGQTLVVEGERQDDRPEDGGPRSGWGYGPFRREIALPHAVDPSDLRGRFRNGLLEVAVPQPPREEHRKRIKVEAV